MRIRRKPWARTELAESPFVIDNPDDCRGRWKRMFKNPLAPLHLELGCGKGGFIAEKAFETPDVNYLAIDLKSEVLALAKRHAERIYQQGGRTVDNLLLASHDIERIDHMLDREDRVERLYINFCNPWPKIRDFKHRLTHPKQLILYKEFLVAGCELMFKTDDDALFEATTNYFIKNGFRIVEHIEDLPVLHEASTIMTEHERMFRDRGLPIHYIAAVLTEENV